MKSFNSIIICSLLYFTMPINAIYIHIDQRIINDLMAMPLSTTNAISCASIAFIAGLYVGSKQERIETNEFFKQLDPELAHVDILECKWTNPKLVILSAITLGCIGLFARIDEQSSAFAQGCSKVMSTTMILTGSIIGILYGFHKMGINIG